jgi:hypothetical protein
MIPEIVWWKENCQGSWSCVNMLNEMFQLYGCKHIPKLRWPFPEDAVIFLRSPNKGAVVVVHGGNLQLNGKGAENAAQINTAISSLEWCILIVIGDEGTEFPTNLLEHQNMRLWIQTPLPTTKAHRFLIEGYPAGTTNWQAIRDLDWFFAGQLTHERRIACYRALEPMSNGILRGTNGFGQGYQHEEYINLMNRAKIVPCPSGPASPDTFRIWEALECGAVPILDARSLKPETIGFWDTVLGKSPLPMIEDWKKLPDMMTAILADYDRIQRFTQYWWKSYKLQWRDWLAKDLIALGAK